MPQGHGPFHGWGGPQPRTPPPQAEGGNVAGGPLPPPMIPIRIPQWHQPPRPVVPPPAYQLPPTPQRARGHRTPPPPRRRNLSQERQNRGVESDPEQGNGRRQHQPRRQLQWQAEEEDARRGRQGRRTAERPPRGEAERERQRQGAREGAVPRRPTPGQRRQPPRQARAPERGADADPFQVRDRLARTPPAEPSPRRGRAVRRTPPARQPDGAEAFRPRDRLARTPQQEQAQDAQPRRPQRERRPPLRLGDAAEAEDLPGSSSSTSDDRGNYDDDPWTPSNPPKKAKR